MKSIHYSYLGTLCAQAKFHKPIHTHSHTYMHMPSSRHSLIIEINNVSFIPLASNLKLKLLASHHLQCSNRVRHNNDDDDDNNYSDNDDNEFYNLTEQHAVLLPYKQNSKRKAKKLLLFFTNIIALR